jgi:mannose-1-phosphate guanylyltransferase
LAGGKVADNTDGKLRAFLLAAGLGTRLAPLTDTLPKCLMPIKGRPVLEYWLRILIDIDADAILVNLHHHADAVRAFLQQGDYRDRTDAVYESELLGTGGSWMKNRAFFQDCTTMLIHADNFCQCDFASFVDFHKYKRPAGTLITMMTHITSNPRSSGIVELDEGGVVIGFHEKVADPPGNLANGAVFLIEPEVHNWVVETYDGGLLDFSRDVIPHFLGRIATWHNDGYFRDIGTHENLKSIQEEDIDLLPENGSVWLEEFRSHPIHGLVSQI